MLNKLRFCITLAVFSVAPVIVEARTFLVENGKPQAEIVIAERTPRSTQLAARELQTYVEKISGATLNIVTMPTGNVPVKVYVGRSSHTEELGITDEGLKHGAYRIASGEDWLVLIGDDTDFVPIEPWPRNNNDVASGKMQRAWDEITGKRWGYTHSQLHKHYSGRNTLFGTPNEEKVDADGNVNVWTYDEHGSFNAVCGFLRDLGVRWYMPGEIGEIVPQMDSIELPVVDKTVHPDFPMRILNFRPGVYGRDVMMWGFRLGIRQPFGRQAAHGLARMTDNEATMTEHPDWFALYGGKRHVDPKVHNNQLCYSNEGLFQEAVQFARAQFDHYDMDVVSIMPPDGYTAICQCELCEGKESPELGQRGMLSNYVWDFVNRVAREVATTHPDKKISNCAYGIYTQPPSNIELLEPNVQVIIVGGRRPTNADRDELRRLRQGWAKKTANPLETFENYPFTGRGFYLPAYVPHIMGESINATKGMSRGEDIWLTMDFGENAIGYNHFLVYFTARMYWGGKDQNVEALFDEYCELFYGPAAGDMREFFGYCEDNWREMESNEKKASQALELFARAKSNASDVSVYGKRLQLIDNFLNGLRNKSVQLAQKRGPVTKLRLVGRSRGEVVIDGKLDDEPWQICPVASTGRMYELQTGRQPIFGTSFKTAWIGNNLYFGIRCEEYPSEKLNIATTKRGDQAIWYGDAVEILLETESHSYYQIVVNPAGALVDLDRGANRNNWFNWSSQAEVATHIDDDHWTVEIRIPITDDENDPLHQVIGRKPTQSLPWHINVCRQRIRENGSEFSAFSPTGTKGFHERMKFAHFYGGRSHQFPADSAVSDYLIASRAAEKLQRSRRFQDAMNAFVALADSEEATDFQASDALQRAASCARSLRDDSSADKLAARIPLDSVSKTTQMENLLYRREYQQIIDEFGNGDLREWPFWQIGAAAFARGRAYHAAKVGADADADLQLALEFTSDSRTRISILRTIATNHEMVLRDDKAALRTYQRVIQAKSQSGSAEYFYSMQGAARVLTRQGKYDEAITLFDLVETDKLPGSWKGSILLTKGQTLAKAGRAEAALKAFRGVLASDSSSKAHRDTAQQAIAELQ